MPVSYTHLDMYKRQVLLYVKKGKIKRRVAQDSKGEQGDDKQNCVPDARPWEQRSCVSSAQRIEGKAHRITEKNRCDHKKIRVVAERGNDIQPDQTVEHPGPVSYTHLDVYKRQVQKKAYAVDKKEHLLLKNRLAVWQL